MKSLAGKVVVISGAGSGIGRQLAIQLSHSGAFVAINDKDQKTLKETTELLGSKKFFSKVLDVSERAAVQQFSQDLVDHFGRVDLLINNAGIGLGKVTTNQMSFDDFELVMNVNFWGMVNHTKALLPYLILREESGIVNISSILGLIGVPYQSAYCASKYAIRGFSESLRTELMLEHPNVFLSVVHPGGTKTNIIANSKTPDNVDPEKYAREEIHFESFFKTTAEEAARKILKGIKRKKQRILVGSDTRLPDLMVRLLPGRYSNLIAGQFKKMIKKYGLEDDD